MCAVKRCRCCTVGLIYTLLLVGLFALELIRRVEKLEVGEAAVLLYNRGPNSKSKDTLPDAWRGVFWMSDNPAPEMLTTLEAGNFDASSRELTLKLATPYSWSYSSDSKGWLEYTLVTISKAFPAKIVFSFSQNMTYADMGLYVLDCFYVKQTGAWSITQLDDKGTQFKRNTLGSDGNINDEASYILKKVIASNGTKLPAFYEMQASVQQGWLIKNKTIKTNIQLVYTDWFGAPGAFAVSQGVALVLMLALSFLILCLVPCWIYDNRRKLCPDEVIVPGHIFHPDTPHLIEQLAKDPDAEMARPQE